MAKRRSPRNPKPALSRARAGAERKRAEEALRASEAKWRALVENAPDFIATMDRKGTIQFLNRVAAGRSLEGVLGSRLQSHVIRAHRDRVTRSLERVFDTGEAESLEVRGVGPDDSKAWYAIQMGPVLREGKVVQVTTVTTDITERKRAEETLRKSEERYRSLYTRTPAMLHSIDRAGRIVAVSDHWLEVLGYERSEVIGRHSVEFLTEDSRRYAEQVALPAYWQEGSARDVPYRFVKKNGEIVEILLSAIAERDAEGKIYRTQAVLTDITERKRAEEELQRAREALEGKVERQMLGRNPYGLTFREFTVLHLVAAGRADKEIAAELVISPLTVHKHVANILGKMDAASRTEAGVRALREGLLD